jgi:uncharacterized membrane protein
MAFISLLVFLFLILSHLSLKKRVSNLEDKLQKRTAFQSNLEKGPVEEHSQPIQPNGNPVPGHQKPETSYVPTETPTVEIPQAPPKQTEIAKAPGEFFLYRWFHEQALIKIGSIIFFLGAVWFVSYAIEQNWISPLMRIALGLLLAFAVYAVGFWRKYTEVTQYQVLTTLGTGIFLATIIASQFAFTAPVLPAAIAFFLMIISIAYTLAVAFQTKTEWLAVVASAAGLLAPMLVKFDEPLAILLLTYILLLSASFLVVVFFTSWRYVSLTLLVGSALHLSSLSGSAAMSDNVLWFFVVIFSTLFCASTSISITRTNTPTVFDVSAMAIITLQFILYANTIAILPGLALFVASAVTAFIGYTLRMRSANADSVSLFVGVSLIFSLVGTAVLFDGFVLTIAYALEALTIYLLSLRLATVERTVIIAAALFSLPFISGYQDLTSPAWNSGIINPEALGTISVLISLGVAVVMTLRNQTLQAIDWLRQTGGGLLVAWYVFAASACVVVARAQQTLDTSFVNTALLSVTAGIVIIYILHSVPRDSWRVGALFTLIVPLVTATTLFYHEAWSEGIAHQIFFAALMFFIGLIGITILYWIYARRNSTGPLIGTCSYLLVWLVLGYGILFLDTIWDALITGDTNRVITSISYTVLIYLIANCLIQARVTASRLVAILATLILPGMLLLESLNYFGWTDGLMSIDAVGLYVTTTILVLLGTSLRQYGMSVPEEERAVIKLATSSIYITSGLLAFSLIWIMSQTAFASDAIAVTVALLIYTVAGLISYSYGRATTSSVWRQAGVLLLSSVILRLALVDFWVMELVWKIVTFLGIGVLFIGTALLERSRDKREIPEEVVSE